MRVGMSQAPFILPALAQVYFVEDASQPSMCVDISGRIGVNPEFVKHQHDSVLGWCVVHELLHLLMNHTARLGSRRLDVFNIATDMAINQIIREANGQLPPGVFYPPSNMLQASAEDLYDVLMQNPPPPTAGTVGAGCGIGKGAEDKPAAGEGSGDGGGKDDAPVSGATPDAQKWKEAAVQAQALSAGTQAGRALARQLAPPPPRCRYDQVLRKCARDATERHGRDDQTWRRVSRRSPDDFILPGWAATKAKGAVIIDASGSVSDEMLAQAASETAAIQRATGVKLFIVVHDAGVQFSGWVDAKTPQAVQGLIKGRGGTTFDEAYREVEAKAGKLDFALHLTDGEIFGHWPNPPANARRFILARLGKDGDQPPPGTIEFLVDM
jgi:predicted metal-dependent peptidase